MWEFIESKWDDIIMEVDDEENEPGPGLDGTILHRFPDPEKDPDRFRTWLYAIDGDLLALDNKTIHKYRRVCHHHFEVRFHTSSNRLCANATPTLNLPGFFVTHRKPLQEIANINVETLCQSDKAEDINLSKPSSSYSFTSKETVKVKSKQLASKGSVQSNQQSVSYLKQKITRLQKSKDDFKKKLKKALVLTENTSFIKVTKNFTTAAMILLMMQIEQANKGKFGRRYSKEEKILSLAFYKMGPRAYRWFRNILVLPAPVTLSRMISNADLGPGINASIFANLKKRAAKMSDIDKLCVILFDEMQLTPHFDYNKKKDLIRGFVDNGTTAENKIADHALVFMLRGINKNYKQPLAYTFCSGSTPKLELKNQIKTIISEVQSAGFNVIATICDQGASNVSAIKELVNDTKNMHLKNNDELKDNFFIINNQEIAPLFDVPHMLKGIGNNMLTRNIICKIDNKQCTGKWDHIIRLYEENPAYKGLRFLPKLTDSHVIPGKIKKMKVLCATQVFSANVAMCMGYFAAATKRNDINLGNNTNFAMSMLSSEHLNSTEKPHAVPKKSNTRDLLMLQNLALSDSEEIISQIYDRKEAFMHLLQSPIQSLDVFALVMEVLAKVCKSSYKLTILLDVCNSPFILSLRNYMADLPYPELKSANDIYWHNPDDFWANFLTFCECIITLSPPTVLEKCRPLIDVTTQLCLDELAKRHDYTLPENCELILIKSRKALIKHEKGKDEKPHDDPKNPNTMDYVMMQNLAKSESEEIISQIYDRKEAFMQLLRSPIQNLDVFALVMELLAKVCQSSYNKTKLTILLDVCNSPFILSLRNYMAGLPYPKLKSANDIYWHNPDDFWANFLTFCECIITLSPPTVLAKCRRLIDETTQLCLEELAKRHGYILPENCKLILIKSREALMKHEKEKDEKPHDSLKKPNTMDSLMLQNFAKSESEEIISQIYDNKEAFMHLLRSPIQNLDVFALVMELLAKVSQSSFDQKKLLILLDVCNSPFILSLRNYMADLPYPELKSANYIYWQNPDEFWGNFLTFCDCVITLSPSTALAKCRTLIDATARLCLDELAGKHDYKLPENFELILIKSREALAKHEKEKIEIEERHNIRHGEDEESEPPENFRYLSVMPTAFDFYEEAGTPYLRANIVKGGYRDVEHYLDVQFRLFREDCFGPLRDGIHQFRKDPTKSKYDSVRVYRNVKFVRPYSSSLKVGVVVELDETTKRSFKKVDWANSKRFIYGSLVLFTRGNSKYYLQAATIIDRDVGLLYKGQIPVSMCRGSGYDFIRDGTYTMIESEIYFEPYYHVLSAMREPSFPQQIVMKKYIIDVNPESEPPAYLGKGSSYIVNTKNGSRKRFKVLDFDTWPSSEELGLNESQYEAYRMALTHEFAVIQGPPGTGKTHLGVKVAETLIKNVCARLLIVCYTNHALDQFLEAILSITDSIVRIGGQSHNEVLEEINLNTLRQKDREEAREERRKPTMIQQVFIEQRRTLRIYINELDDTNKLIENLDTYVISYDDLKRYEPKIPDLRQFYRRSNGIFTDPLHLWLFEHDVYDLNEPVMLENEDIENPDNNTDESDDRHDLHREIIIRRSIIRFEEMKSQYQQGVKVSNQTNMLTDIDPTSISPVDRWMLYFTWTENIADRVRARASRLQDAVQDVNDEYEESRMRVDYELLRGFKVIGMTTSGAARMRKLIENLAPTIVIVEEAAEVMEQHIIMALTESCEHLILIGDHQQLRPSASNIKLARHYNIEVSLFERMVMNGIQSRRLSVQHRMRPEIAALISPAIYPDLQNHPSVSEFPDVRGVTCSVFFFTHNYKEEVVYDGASKTNEKEGDMVLGLANYLIQQEYKPEDVTILAAYSGQMFYMKKQKFKYSHLSDVRITVLDNYQGEESKIILLSLVRNNDENKIGFLSADNRVCVALSRAKQGFYMFGNIEILKSKSPLWRKVAATLESFGSLGTSIRLMCPNHDQINVISTPQDFSRKVPEGGCLQKCDKNLPCLHACPLPCHGYDQEHRSIQCTLKCERILCELNHVCPLMCMEVCRPCNKKVMKRLTCGHDMLVSCHVAPDDPDVQCLARVPAKLPSCGHEVKKPCYMAPEKVKCPVPCKNVIEKCGHMCTHTCHVEDDPSHEQYLCKKPCTKAKSGCTMELEGDRGAHQCVKMCHEECDECEVEVVKKRNACKHKETVACSKSPDEKPCNKNCARVLACGHFCKLKCYEPCGNCKQLVKKQIPECGHEISLECSVEPERECCEKACERTMSCGHQCRGRCGDPCDPTACGELVQCASPCGHPVQLPCNDYVASGADVNPEVLLQRCTAPCDTELACGHACAGSCVRCRQGRLHAPCVQPCRQLGLCGHRCPAPCNQLCPPCEQPCGAKCPHSRCPRPSGAPFEPCQEACSRACPHGACARRCGEGCAREACARTCARALRCGHPCRGLCGERCPDVCEPCQDDTRFIVLEDCGHIMEFENTEKLMKEYSSLVAMRSCPYCRKRIINTPRYINLVNSMLAKEINTNEERIIARRRELQEIVENFHHIHSSIYTDELYPHWKEAFDQIIPVVKSDKKYSLLQLEMYFIYLNILELLSDVYKKYTTESLTELQESLIDQNKTICEELVNNVHNISQQQQSDIENEIERMYAIVHLARIISHPSYVENKSVPEVKETVDAAKRVIFKSGLYDHDKATEALNAIQNAINVSGVVTKMERLNIKAIGAKAGQWFRCPKGHFYRVEKCGGDIEVSRCVECIAEIGEGKDLPS